MLIAHKWDGHFTKKSVKELERKYGKKKRRSKNGGSTGIAHEAIAAVLIGEIALIKTDGELTRTRTLGKGSNEDLTDCGRSSRDALLRTLRQGCRASRRSYTNHQRQLTSSKQAERAGK
jgi:hypothetical protein